MAGALLGLSFVARAAGDVGNGVLTWFSPIGWTSLVQAFTRERWWVLGVFVAAVAVLVRVAFVLVSHRDLGAGLWAGRPGRPRARPLLLRPTG